MTRKKKNKNVKKIIEENELEGLKKSLGALSKEDVRLFPWPTEWPGGSRNAQRINIDDLRTRNLSKKVKDKNGSIGENIKEKTEE